MSNNQSIVAIAEREDLPALFLSNDDKNQSRLVELVTSIETEARKMVFDINTDDGKQGIKSLAFNIAKAKNTIDRAGKELKDELSVDIKIIDGLRNMSKGRLGELQEQIRAPLTELEQKEKQRKLDIEARLEWLSSAGNESMSSNEILSLIKTITSQPIDDSWDEYKADAIAAHEYTLIRLNDTYQKVKQAEDDAAELEELRAMKIKFQNEERERIAAEKARLQAEEVAKAQAEKARIDHFNEMEKVRLREEKARQDHQQQIEDQKRQAQEELQKEQERIAAIEREAAEESERIERERQELILNEAREAEQLKKNQQLKDQASNALYEDLIANRIPKTHASKIVKLVLDDKLASWADLAQFV